MQNFYREGLTKIAVMYIGWFEKNPEQVLRLFCNTEAPLEIMVSVYKQLEEVKKIETLPHDTKKKLWEQAKQTCPAGDKAKIVRMCKCIWLINSILEK